MSRRAAVFGLALILAQHAPADDSLRARIAQVDGRIRVAAPGLAVTNAMQRVKRARYAVERYVPGPEVDAFADRELRHAAAQLARTAITPRMTGGAIEGFHSDIDDSIQPFWRYLPRDATNDTARPLMVYLHGYFPDQNIVNWTLIPSNLTATAEALGFAAVAPFARGNTDFQGIGEQDVLRVVDEMCARYPIDRERIILVGWSMGGMGAYAMAAHDPARFAGALIIAARGSYYFWQGRDRATEPAYRRYMIDADFAHSMLENLTEVPFMIGHGRFDLAVPVREGRYMAEAVRAVNSSAIYIEDPLGDHFVFDRMLARPQVRAWLKRVQRDAARPAPIAAWDAQLGRRRWGAASATDTAARPSTFKQAHLSPFIYVDATREDDAIFTRAVGDWRRFALEPPRMAKARTISPVQLRNHNVFLFGESAASPLIQKVLEGSPVNVDATEFVADDLRVPCSGHGMIVVRPSPWNPARLAVVCVGAAWGRGLPSNHLYDFIPDYIIFEAEGREWDGANRARAAGFFGPDWQILPDFRHQASDAAAD